MLNNSTHIFIIFLRLTPIFTPKVRYFHLHKI